ncbi:unnamed protein product, partial [Mesorhabditis spiculigera]
MAEPTPPAVPWFPCVKDRSSDDWQKIFEMKPVLGEQRLILTLEDGGTLIKIEDNQVRAGSNNQAVFFALQRRYLLVTSPNAEGNRRRIYFEKRKEENFMVSDMVDRDGVRIDEEKGPYRLREMWLEN